MTLDKALLDNLRHGVDVISTDSKNVGELYAVVVDPRDNQLTHIVVNIGPHFPMLGFGAPALTKVPIEEMADAQEGRVILKCTKQVFEKMPSYVARQFFPAPAHAKGSQPPTDVVWDASVALAAAIGRTTGLPVPLERFRKARFERHILNDAPVWRQEPHQKLGEVERLLSDEIDDEIQALVVRRGEFFAKEVILPIDYVTEVMDGVVRVQISDAELESLEEFKPD